MEKLLSRQEILDTILSHLKQLDYVYAIWEGGAAAFNRIDEWSDIDLQLIAEEDKADAVFFELENALRKISPIENKYVIPQPTWHGHDQAFYKLQKASEYTVIDFVVMKQNSKNYFLEKEIHGNAIVHLDRINFVHTVSLDKKTFNDNRKQRATQLIERFKMFQFLTKKELNRGNYIEALDTYYRINIETIIELLRMQYSPYHYNFRYRYIYYDLPKEIVHKIEKLSFIKDKDDLHSKYLQTVDWFNELEKEFNIYFDNR